ncbi:MAG: hypothetical protein DME19_12955 [Verrucomicrobia bacterium]|nr:MAG: hypothetical protein DME19_12955 [Verrucomicrobiota bacterium]
MKKYSCLIFRRGWFFLLICASFLLPPVARAAVGFTVSPSSLSNTYSGQITLQISGLTNGETVLVERFLDVNRNGIDPGDLLVQSFKVTDGQVTAFGGIRDVNVPGDDDGSSNGLIQTSFSFNSAPEFSRAAGQHVFRVSSPSGGLAVQTLNVTQPLPAAQFITGQITNSLGALVPYPTVALLVQTGQDVQFVVGAVGSASGDYTVVAAPGTYLVLPTKVGFVSDLSTAPVITLNAGEFITQNLELTPGTQTISGTIADAATGNGIPGLQLFLESSNNKLAIAFTDANGDFTVSTVPDQWKLDISDFNLSQSGYLRPQNKPRIDTTAGGVTGVNVQLAKEAALIYGSLKNDTNASLQGISLFGNDNNNQYEANATTDATGNYTMGVTAGTWFIGPDNQNPGLAGYIVQGTNVMLTNGQALLVNFVAQRSTAHLLGRVTDTGGSPISGLTILASPQNGGSSPSATTAADGSFDIALFGGTWILQLESGSAAQHNVIGPSLNFNVTDGINISNITYVVRAATATISGNVTNNNGQPLANVNVSASITVNGTNYMSNAQTDGTGHYKLSAFTNATWQVSLDCFGLNQQGYGCPNSQNVTISGPNGTANFLVPPGAQFSFLFRHFANAGDFGSGFTPAPAFPVAINAYSAQFTVRNDINYPSETNVFFTGPPGSSLTGSPAVVSLSASNVSSYLSAKVGNPSTGPAGTWMVNYKGNLISFNVPDPQAAARLVIPLPGVQIQGAGGGLGYVFWNYKDPNNGNPISSTPAFITGLEVQILDRDLNVVNDSGLLGNTALNYNLGSITPWKDVGQIRIIYWDTLTNQYFVTFTKALANLGSARRPSSNQFQVQLNGLSGQDYVVEYSTTLTNWFPLFTTNAPSSAFNILDSNATDPHRFYRVHTP